MFDEFLLAAPKLTVILHDLWLPESQHPGLGGARSNIWFQAQEPKDEISEEVAAEAAEVTPEVEATAEEQVGVGVVGGWGWSGWGRPGLKRCWID